MDGKVRLLSHPPEKRFFGDFTLHRLKFYLLNVLGSKQKLVEVAVRVTLDRM